MTKAPKVDLVIFCVFLRVAINIIRDVKDRADVNSTFIIEKSPDQLSNFVLSKLLASKMPVTIKKNIRIKINTVTSENNIINFIATTHEFRLSSGRKVVIRQRKGATFSRNPLFYLVELAGVEPASE
ncbi:TPA: hypothetical protein JD250_05915 [Proteus mirabilis]|nr:hypothetical protein [Proteus mirabilis]HAU5533679.1 hypothetical protein [Proteus mirabilis]HAU5537217.1 hypothetical protein [Proteus mirabilis]HAU5541135.1 hypothetical protein [Proteus mirabilis]HAU5571693.1 hypothetical protein [Proteus mirabilis]